MDPYEYAAPAAEGLVPLCKKIASTKTKDALVKSLKQLVSILEACTQDVEALGRGKDELPRTVLHLLQHADKDVKLYLAVCIVNMLRIWAPETPYDGDPENLEVRGGDTACAAPPEIKRMRRAARAPEDWRRMAAAPMRCAHAWGAPGGACTTAPGVVPCMEMPAGKPAAASQQLQARQGALKPRPAPAHLLLAGCAGRGSVGGQPPAEPHGADLPDGGFGAAGVLPGALVEGLAWPGPLRHSSHAVSSSMRPHAHQPACCSGGGSRPRAPGGPHATFLGSGAPLVSHCHPPRHKPPRPHVFNSACYK